MTDDDFPEGVTPEVAALAAAPLDDTDAALLGDLADVLTAVDPVPDDLVARVQFALALDEVYAEVAAVTRLETDALAVREDTATGMRTETLTFSAERLTAMVTVSRSGPEQVRLDGWLAPPAALRIHLRMQEGTAETVADEAGRFVLEDLPEGFAQLTFHLGESGASGEDEVVVTPLFQL